MKTFKYKADKYLFVSFDFKKLLTTGENVNIL